jgi:hypothetical protein
MYLLKYFLFIFLVLFSLRPALAMEPTPKQSNWLHATLTQNLVSRNQKLLHNQAKELKKIKKNNGKTKTTNR